MTFTFWYCRRWLSLAIALVVALSLTSCQARLWQSRLKPVLLKTEAAELSQIVLTTLQEPGTFNPALNSEFPSIFQFAFRGLTTENGVTGEIEPALAESWRFSQDQQRLEFTLRSGLQWSDGEPLTVDDIIFTYRDVIFNAKIPTPLKDSFRIGAGQTFPIVRKLDDRRIEFVLPEPFAPILRATSALSSGAYILPKHILQESVEKLDTNGNPAFISTWNTGTDPKQIVVNGPYLLEQHQPGERIIFRRNPHYWQRDDQGQRLPYIDRIIWQFMESTDTQLLRFRSGELDVLGDVRPLRPEYFSLLKREEKRGKFKLRSGGPWSGSTYIAFNLNTAKTAKGQPLVDPVKSRWFNTLAFRQAVAYAIDRPRMINNIYRGISQPQDSPISVQSPYYLSPAAGLKTYSYNPAKAKQLLVSAGFRYDAAGQLFDEEGHRVQFNLITNAGNRIREALGSQIRVDLSRIGMQVDFTPINFNTLLAKLDDTRDWDCHLIGFTGGLEPNDAANLWISTGNSHSFNLSHQPGQPNITGWEPKDWERELDRLFNQGARELDETKRKQIYAQFQRVVQEQLPVIHLVHEIALVAVRDRLQGLKYSGLPSWGLWNIQELKVEE
jgi:peptide/nickel transport system substrate-binding protein